MTKVLFIMPMTYSAHLPHYTSRFELLSEIMESHVLLSGDTAQDHKCFPGGVLHVLPRQTDFSVLGKMRFMVSMIRKGLRIARREKIDVVWAYDPLKHGIIATCIKLLTGCKSVIEINGHLKNAHAAGLVNGNPGLVKKLLFNTVCALTLWLATTVKILNLIQFQEWRSILKCKPCFLFHDFVPTSLFQPGGNSSSFILSVGFPFRLKGVDVLLEAYAAIHEEFPGLRLVVMGHCREPELSRWKAMFAAVPGAELRKPVPYDQMQEVLHGCILFALPSRSEAMGRVLIEAMACGKPVVGSNVGGIPDVLGHGEAGLLVRPGDAKDLADKLRLLLGDAQLRQRLGEAARRRSQDVLSEESYVRSCEIVLAALERRKGAPLGTGVVYSVYG